MATFLADHPAVESVFYPGLAGHPGHEIAKSQMRDFGGMVSFRVRGGEAAAVDVCGRTRLFIHRPYDWQLVDLMMTNFHLPRTTLLLMIDAFVGSRWRDLYATALAEDYRFLSFGDAMLLDRHAA